MRLFASGGQTGFPSVTAHLFHLHHLQLVKVPAF
jgi:hypothetical protein